MIKNVIYFGKKFLEIINVLKSSNQNAEKRIYGQLVDCFDNAYESLCNEQKWEFLPINNMDLFETVNNKMSIKDLLISASGNTVIIDDEIIGNFCNKFIAEVSTKIELSNYLGMNPQKQNLFNLLFVSKKNTSILEKDVQEDKRKLTDNNIHECEKQKKSSKTRGEVKENSIIENSKKYIDETINQCGSDTKQLKTILTRMIKERGEDDSLKTVKINGILNRIKKTKEKYILSLIGLQGTGKSTLISLIYSELLQEKTDKKIDVFPILIDFHYWMKINSDNKKPKETLENEIKKIERFVSQKKYSKYIILVDGLDDSNTGTSELDLKIKRVLQIKDCKFILSMSQAGKIAEDLKKTVFTSIDCINQSKIKLEMHRLKNDQDGVIPEVVESLAKIWKVESKNIDSLKKAVVKTAINKIDFRTIIYIIKMYKNAINPKKILNSLGQVYYEYYLNYVKDKETLLYVSKLVFDYEIEKKIPEKSSVAYWDIIFKNANTRDFFLAVHFISHFTDIEKWSDCKSYYSKEIVYTAQVNRFIKELLDNKFASKIGVFIKNAKKVFEECSCLMKSQICYVLGRITKYNEQYDNKEFLISEWEKIYNKLKNKELIDINVTANDMLFLYRTISVSLLNFSGVTKQHNSFLLSLLTNKKLNQINRGFHLEYYGDIPFINGTQPLCVDTGAFAIDKTMMHLYGNISRALNEEKSKYRMIYLDIVTLFSLYQYRIDNEQIINKYKEKLVMLLKTLLKSEIVLENDVIKEYLFTMDHYFEEIYPDTYQNMIKELYNVKNIKRKGWVKREITDPETIADHMYSSCLLALFFLPENISMYVDEELDDFADYDDYSKNRIIEMLLLHDLAETITDDIATPDKDDKDEEKEIRIMKMFTLYNSFPNIYGVGDKRVICEEFFENKSCNAKIAHDLDKIDMLIQAYLYKEKEKDKIKILEWKDSVFPYLKSSIGKIIARLVEDAFAKNVVEGQTD